MISALVKLIFVIQSLSEVSHRTHWARSRSGDSIKRMMWLHNHILWGSSCVTILVVLQFLLLKTIAAAVHASIYGNDNASHLLTPDIIPSDSGDYYETVIINFEPESSAELEADLSPVDIDTLRMWLLDQKTLSYIPDLDDSNDAGYPRNISSLSECKNLYTCMYYLFSDQPQTPSTLDYKLFLCITAGQNTTVACALSVTKSGRPTAR